MPVIVTGVWKSKVSSCAEIIDGAAHSSCDYCSCKGAVPHQAHEPQLQWIYAWDPHLTGIYPVLLRQVEHPLIALFFHWSYMLTSVASSASAAARTHGDGLTSTEPKSGSAVPVCPARCLGRALPIGAGWWRTQSDDLHCPWRESLPEGAHAPSHPQLEQHPCHLLCQSHLPLARHVLSGASPASAQVPCNRSIFTRCPRSQLWFRYANRAARLPLLPHIWPWLWPATATYCCQQNSEFKFASCKRWQGS